MSDDEEIADDLGDDFDQGDISDEEESVEFEDDEIEDYRDLESKSIRFANQTLNIDLNDEHHCTVYIVPDNERTTSQIMTLEEMTEAVGIRATEIENGARCFTDVTGYTCPIEMAKKEILDGKSPYKLMREMSTKKGSKTVEIWKINDMTLPITRRESMQITKARIAELGLIPAEEVTPKPTKISPVVSPKLSPKTPSKEKEKSPKTPKSPIKAPVKAPVKKAPKKAAVKKAPAKK